MNKIDGIGFQAKPINKVIIQKFDKKTKNFFPCEATFVMLDHKNKGDIAAINNLSKSWKGATFLKNISTSANWMDDKKFSHIHVYAVTTQEKNFKKLSPTKILGLVEMRKDDDKPKNTILHFLQVKPIAMHKEETKKRVYKQVGTGILNSLKKIYKSMSLFSDNGVEPFYEKNGFIHDNYGKGHYVWYSNILKRWIVKLRVCWEDLKLEMTKNKL